MFRLKLTVFVLLATINVFAQKLKTIFLDKSDSNRNYYTIIYPAIKPKGCLFLLAGFGESPENVLLQTDLAQIAAKNGLLTVIPVLQDGVLSFGVDSLSQATLAFIVKEVIDNQQLANLPLYMGGFSMGGAATLMYAEKSAKKPNAIFAIDPPLDFERFYYAAQRNIRLSKNGEQNPENLYIVERLEKETKGNPHSHKENYYQISPYSWSDSTQTAIKKLLNTPIRIYSEPDINWWLKERQQDLTSMNVSECSALINELNRLGHKNAKLMLTQDKGRRKPNNQKHPHSWSIVNNQSLINWLLKHK